VTSTNQPSGQPTLASTTGSDGSISFIKVKPGDYSFLVAFTEYQSESVSVKAVESQTTEKTVLLTKIPQQSQGIPGFPMESVLVGIGIAIILILFWMRQRN